MPYEKESACAFDMLDMFIQGDHCIENAPEYVKKMRLEAKHTRSAKSFSNDVNVEELCKKIQTDWLEKSQRFRGIKKISHEHSCAHEKCYQKGNITRFPRDIYRCETSGKVHNCGPSGLGCKDTLLTHEGIYVCIFSAKILGECLVNEDFHKEEDENAIVEFNNEESSGGIQPQKIKNQKTQGLKIKNATKSKKKIVDVHEQRDNVTSSAKFLMTNLIMNWKIRERINSEKKTTVIEHLKSDFKKRMRQSLNKNNAPLALFFGEFIQKYEHTMGEKNFMCKVEQTKDNMDWIQYYRGLTGVLWDVITNSPHFYKQENGISPKKFAIGSLYLFKESYACGPKDLNWIYHALPNEPDLPLFKESIQDVTKSVTYIKECLNSYSKTELKSFVLASFEDYHKKKSKGTNINSPVPFLKYIEK